jgi:hypothetical protein
MAVDQTLTFLAGYFREHPTARAITIGFSYSFLFILCLVASFFAYQIFVEGDATEFAKVALGATVGAIAVLSRIPSQLNPQQDSELAPIRKEREEIRDRIKEKEPDIFDTIQLNLNQLSEYYTINKSQARNSFRASLTAIVIGFITIIIGIWLFYVSDKPNPNLTYMTVIGGVLLQFIGAAYFYLYNKSLIQLNFFFARLTMMQDTMLSIKLVDQISEMPIKAKILERLIFEIITRDASTRKYLGEGTLPRLSTQEKTNRKARKGKEVTEITMPTAQTPRAA